MTHTRRKFSAQEKVALLRQHLVEKVPVSDLCDEGHRAPNLFYRWQKEFFENGAEAIWAARDARLAARRPAATANRKASSLGKEMPGIQRASETEAAGPEPVEGWRATRQ